jgi:hypothetical protein
MSALEPAVEVRERGRRRGVLGCDAYFEVLTVRVSGLSKVKVFAIDEAGKVTGQGHEYRSEGFAAGMIFEVLLRRVSPERIAQWHVQASGYNRPPSATNADALTPHSLTLLGAPVTYVDPPAELAPTQPAMPKIKGGYGGEVVSSVRSDSFHHPACRSVRAFVPENRRTFSSPREAWEAGLFPCFSCLL